MEFSEFKREARRGEVAFFSQLQKLSGRTIKRGEWCVFREALSRAGVRTGPGVGIRKGGKMRGGQKEGKNKMMEIEIR